VESGIGSAYTVRITDSFAETGTGKGKGENDQQVLLKKEHRDSDKKNAKALAKSMQIRENPQVSQIIPMCNRVVIYYDVNTVVHVRIGVPQCIHLAFGCDKLVRHSA
jgi:hypothetical protein